ncbi:MAG: ribose 5-phosphate isomerase A [Ferruginibacter sp.]
MDFKKAAAEKAVSFIQTNTVIGLGAGSTMAHIAALLNEKINKGLKIEILTSSYATRKLLEGFGINLVEANRVSSIDIYFDGCDQVDKNLNALKSGGGIHTQEKILASMAKEFMIVGDEGKYVNSFDIRYPLVIEILPQAIRYVTSIIEKEYPGVATSLRINDKRDGAVLSDNGNYLLDVFFKEWPELSVVNNTVKYITGVVETSLFYNIASSFIMGGKDGVRILSKRKVSSRGIV